MEVSKIEIIKNLLEGKYSVENIEPPNVKEYAHPDGSIFYVVDMYFPFWTYRSQLTVYVCGIEYNKSWKSGIWHEDDFKKEIDTDIINALNCIKEVIPGRCFTPKDYMIRYLHAQHYSQSIDEVEYYDSYDDFIPLYNKEWVRIALGALFDNNLV